MQIEKKVDLVVTTTDGIRINEGDTVIFRNGEFDVVGIFNGINNRGCLEFESVLDGTVSKLMPKSIGDTYFVEPKVFKKGVADGK